jgi:hypothetical protein
MSRRKYGENWAGWHTPRHISLFSPNNIELLLKKGWKVSEINTYGTMDPYLLYWMSEMEQKESHGIRIWKMNFGNLCLECYNLYQNGGKAGLPSSYDNNCNSTITCFKSPKGLFPPKYHLIYKVEILKTALLNTIHIRVFLMASLCCLLL